jgi:hypothetical protein
MAEVLEDLSHLEREIEKQLKVYEKISRDVEGLREIAYKLRHALSTTKLDEVKRRRGERAYERLRRRIGQYESALKLQRKRLEYLTREVKKLREILPKEERKRIEELEKKLYSQWGVPLSLLITFLFLASLNYFRILSKTLEITGYASLPTFSFSYFHLILGIFILIALFFTFRKLK